jgi:uncharacterized protein YjbI with pentapeptide repeats
MANQEHLDILKQGVEVWNKWRVENPEIQPDLQKADLSGADLNNFYLWGADLSRANLRRAKLNFAFLNNGATFRDAILSEATLWGAKLYEADFSGAALNDADLNSANLYRVILSHADLSGANLRSTHLEKANLSHAILRFTNLSGANLSEAHLSRATLRFADLSGADFSGADLSGAILNEANLSGVVFSGATLRGADFSGTNLSGKNFSGMDLSGVNLNETSLIKTNFSHANLSNCSIYGIAAWDLQLDEQTVQKNLIITPPDQPTITVDNLKVAQFIYLLLNNEEIREVINTIGQKGVLILGRFSKERKPVLDALREKLRALNFLPIVFDFERPTAQDFTETVKVLAGLSCFIIADITNPKSTPLELQATVPDYMLPFVPILQEGEQPFSMFVDLKRKYSDWVLDTLMYDTPSHLIQGLEEAVVKPALEKHAELLVQSHQR